MDSGLPDTVHPTHRSSKTDGAGLISSGGAGESNKNPKSMLQEPSAWVVSSAAFVVSMIHL